MVAVPPAVMPYLPELITHISAGCVAILAGYGAVVVAKGERLHRRFGTVFVIAMLIVAGMGTYLAFSLQGVMKGQTSNIAEAHRYAESGHKSGDVAVTVG